MFVIALTLAGLLTVSVSQAIAQDGTPATPATPAAPAAPQTPPDAPAEREKRPSFHIGGEAKLGIRHSDAEEWRIPINFPPSFILPGDDGVYERTPAAGTSFDIQNIALIGEGALTDGVDAMIRVHFYDLYNRNPTSSDDRVFIREAWIRVGHAFDKLEPISGTTGYLLVGQAPRFSKPLTRRLESYGLWTNAVARFENPQIQLGGTFGRHVYWRASIGNGNPLFMRDVNALAGDNGTPERVPNNLKPPIYESGFVMLYDAKAQDINPNGRFEWGFGGGYAVSNDTFALDVLGWAFGRTLADTTDLRGTYYAGDFAIFNNAPFAFDGDRKIERGVNVDLLAGRVRVFGQYVDQDIAGLPRRGYEVEAAYRIPLNGLFLIGETPVLNWLQPVVRVSHIDNRFIAPASFPAPSFDWDWTKIDAGFRLGVSEHIDFTWEYNVNRAKADDGMVTPNEMLATFRVGF
jgi:hypothetical protein